MIGRVILIRRESEVAWQYETCKDIWKKCGYMCWVSREGSNECNVTQCMCMTSVLELSQSLLEPTMQAYEQFTSVRAECLTAIEVCKAPPPQAKPSDPESVRKTWELFQVWVKLGGEK
eukprot:2703944-Rhodomonas_salina.1